MEANFTYEFLGFNYRVEATFEDVWIGDGSIERDCTALEVFGPDGSEVSGQLASFYSGDVGRALKVSVLDSIETEARENL